MLTPTARSSSQVPQSPLQGAEQATRRLVTRSLRGGDARSRTGAGTTTANLRLLAVDAVQRVRTVAMLFLVIFLCALPVAWILNEGVVRWVFVTLCVVMVGISLGVLWLLAVGGVAPSAAVRLGLAYVVGGALAMAVGEVVLAPTDGVARQGFGGLALWLVIWPLFIPVPPGRALRTALVAASTVPVCYALARWGGLEPVPSDTLLRWLLPNYVAAGIAWGIAFQVSRWGKALAKAEADLAELGSYQLVRRIGAGGMGEVWQARHRLLQRPAAIKFIARRAQSPDSLAIQRFVAEAQAVSSLRCAHTVALYDFGISEQGERFQVMELLDGLDLHEVVSRCGPLPVDRAVGILRGIAESLAEAHAAGLVHGDIKPGNVMVCRQGIQCDFAKVLDFGLVRSVGVAEATEAADTLDGTPGYIAPELLLAPGVPVPCHDVYAFGAVAWWLLCGQAVFPGLEGERLLVAQVRKDAPLLTLERSDLPPALAQLIQACLSREPKLRPANGHALLQALRAIPAQGDWDESRAAAWWSALAVPAQG